MRGLQRFKLAKGWERSCGLPRRQSSSTFYAERHTHPESYKELIKIQINLMIQRSKRNFLLYKFKFTKGKRGSRKKRDLLVNAVVLLFIRVSTWPGFFVRAR